MDPEGFTSGLFRWNPTRALVQAPPPVPPPPQQQPATPQTAAFGMRLGGLEGLFGAYGIRFYTAAKIAELGFTASTLVGMKDEELEEMMNSLSHIFRWELLVGERYGIKAAVRAERRRLQEEEEESSRRRHLLLSAAGDSGTHHALDALSQEGLSEEPVQHQDQTDAAGNNGGGGSSYWEAGQAKMKKQQQQRRRKKTMVTSVETDDDVNEGEDDDGMDNGNGGGGGLGTERQREHPFIVTEPGEVARGKKNGLDYLFHLYEQCREFLLQVQTIAKDRGEKCPTKSIARRIIEGLLSSSDDSTESMSSVPLLVQTHVTKIKI